MIIRTKYLEKALLVRRELGTNISEERLDLEIYLRTNSEADGANVLGESDFMRFFKQDFKWHPQKNPTYFSDK